MPPKIEDLRIQWTKVVLPPVFLEEDLPITENATATIFNARTDVSAILSGRDSRLLVLVGPCSIHDTRAAREYALLLKSAISRVLRGPAHRHAGLLREAPNHDRMEGPDQRSLPRSIVQDQRWTAPGAASPARSCRNGVPTGTEFLDMISPQYIAGLVSWGAIGARTTESQVHRQLVSGVSCAVGFKNATSGDVQVAIDAILPRCTPTRFSAIANTVSPQSSSLPVIRIATSFCVGVAVR